MNCSGICCLAKISRNCHGAAFVAKHDVDDIFVSLDPPVTWMIDAVEAGRAPVGHPFRLARGGQCGNGNREGSGQGLKHHGIAPECSVRNGVEPMAGHPWCKRRQEARYCTSLLRSERPCGRRISVTVHRAQLDRAAVPEMTFSERSFRKAFKSSGVSNSLNAPRSTASMPTRAACRSAAISWRSRLALLDKTQHVAKHLAGIL